MKAFEFHFNPTTKKDVIYDSFCFDPEGVDEKKLGNLYMTARLSNALPKNPQLLNKLSSLIKENYYVKLQESPEQSLSSSLKQANKFLENLAKTGNVDWLGNLNFAALCIAAPDPSKGFSINFAKVGKIKILALREGEILDIGQDSELQNIDSHPLKIFGSIVTGKLAEGDRIIVSTQEFFQFLLEQDLIKELVDLKNFEENELKKIFKAKEKDFQKFSGICLLIDLKPDKLLLKKNLKIFSFETLTSSYKALISPISFLLKLSSQSIQGKKLPQVKFFESFKTKRKSLENLLVTKIEKPNKFIKTKKLIFIPLLILFLIFSFLIFRNEKETSLFHFQQALEEVQVKKIQAENALIAKDENKANVLFQEAWDKILPQIKTKNPLNKEVLSLKKSIEESLISLNKIEKISEPKLVFEFQSEDVRLSPQKILNAGGQLYFLNPFSSKLYALSAAEESKSQKLEVSSLLKADHNLKFGVSHLNSPLFFAEQNFLISLNDEEFKEETILPPVSGFNFDEFSSFKSSIYFLDAEFGKIIKYPAPTFKENEVLSGKQWLSPKSKKIPTNAKDSGETMAIDGSIWLLTKDNKIDRYFSGDYKNTIELNIFPKLKNPVKIWTSPYHSELYLLEPLNQRILILTKHGEIVKQYQSEKFDNLLDFAVSENGEIIWLLNGLQVYQISS